MNREWQPLDLRKLPPRDILPTRTGIISAGRAASSEERMRDNPP